MNSVIQPPRHSKEYNSKIWIAMQFAYEPSSVVAVASLSKEPPGYLLNPEWKIETKPSKNESMFFHYVSLK